LYRSGDSTQRPAQAGFTLIEALVALAVIAISLVAIGSLVAANTRGTLAIDQRLSLEETARAIVSALPDRDQLVPGSTQGELAGNRWRIDVLPFTASFVDPARSGNWVPRAVVVRVEAPDGAILRLDTVRLQRVQANPK
jgi:general secretion pathway protein I